ILLITDKISILKFIFLKTAIFLNKNTNQTKMNKLTTFIICIILSINVSAQIDFFKFIESIKWNSTEIEIVKQYPTLIEKRKHETNPISNFEVNYGIDKIELGGYNFNADFCISTNTKKL